MVKSVLIRAFDMKYAPVRRLLCHLIMTCQVDRKQMVVIVFEVIN